MEFLNQFLYVFTGYIRELWLVLAVGFLFSGFFYKFVPTNMVERHLGNPGLRSIAIASVVGVVLPLCCIGTLPVAMTMRRKGATLGAVLAFLVATPATSISALFVCWKLLGAGFTAAIFLAAVIMAFVIGTAGNWLAASSARDALAPAGAREERCDSCSDPSLAENTPGQSWRDKVKDALHNAFIVLPKEMGREILLGIAVASFIVSFSPVQQFIRTYLIDPVIGYTFILVFGLIDYVCSTASVPMADALIHSGMSRGQALAYLLLGPVTSYATLLVIRKTFGWKTFWIYTGVISVVSVLSGVVYDILTG